MLKEFRYLPIYNFNRNWTAQRFFTKIWHIDDFWEIAWKYNVYPIIKFVLLNPKNEINGTKIYVSFLLVEEPQ